MEILDISDGKSQNLKGGSYEENISMEFAYNC